MAIEVRNELHVNGEGVAVDQKEESQNFLKDRNILYIVLCNDHTGICDCIHKWTIKICRFYSR